MQGVRNIERLRGLAGEFEGEAGTDVVCDGGAADLDVDAAGGEVGLQERGAISVPVIVVRVQDRERAADDGVVDADVDVGVDVLAGIRVQIVRNGVDAEERVETGIPDGDVDVDRVVLIGAEAAVADVSGRERAADDRGVDVSVHHVGMGVAGDVEHAGRGVVSDEGEITGRVHVLVQAVDRGGDVRADQDRGVVFITGVCDAGRAVDAAGAAFEFERGGDIGAAFLAVVGGEADEVQGAAGRPGGRLGLFPRIEHVHAHEQGVAGGAIEGIAVDESGPVLAEVDIIGRKKEQVARVRGNVGVGIGREDHGGIGFARRADDRDIGCVEVNHFGIDVEDQTGAGAFGGVDDDGHGGRDRLGDGQARGRVDGEGGGGSNAADLAVAGDEHVLRGDVADDRIVEFHVESGSDYVHAGLVAGDDDPGAGLGGRDRILDAGERVLAEHELVAVDEDVGVSGEIGVDEQFVEGVDHDGRIGLHVLVEAGLRADERDRPGVHAAFGAHDLVGADQVADIDGDRLRSGGSEVAGNDERGGVVHRDGPAEGQAVRYAVVGLVREGDFSAGVDGDAAGDFRAAGHVHPGGRQIVDAGEIADADESGVDEVDVVQE